MITDRLALFFDDEDAVASANSLPVYVGKYIGRGEPLFVSFIVKGDNAAAVSLDVAIEESDDKTTWDGLGSVLVSKPNKEAAFISFALPVSAKKEYLQLKYTLTGAAAGLNVWAGITRDHFAPYEPGLYINKGEVVG